jgi:hypothetical protein
MRCDCLFKFGAQRVALSVCLMEHNFEMGFGLLAHDDETAMRQMVMASEHDLAHRRDT